MSKGKAFTLAEVLIVLAIIGVVAALTMPMLMNNYQKTQQVTALKKAYSQITDAIDRLMVDENLDNLYESEILQKTSAGNPKGFLKKYFRVSKYCTQFDAKDCISKPTSMDKTNTNNPAINETCVFLKDGSSICLDPGDPNHAVGFFVDTNGLDKPNIGGRDIFKFFAYANGTVDEIEPEDLASGGATARDALKDGCESSSYGAGCLSKIMDAGWKMDY